MPKGGLKLTKSTQFQQKLKLPNGVLIAALIAVAIIATSFSGFKPTAFATSVSSCTNINADGSYQLTGNLFSIGTCINITSHNTELDCNNNWINQSTGGTNIVSAINVSGVTNVTIRNCRINGYTYSIGVLNSTRVNITSNTLTNGSALPSNGASIYLWKTNSSTVSGNTILNTTVNGVGITVDDSLNATVRNNTVMNAVGGGISFQSNSLVTPGNHTIENNTIEYSVGGISITDNYGSNRNSNISSNIIRHVTGGVPGIQAIYGNNLTIKFNIVENSTDAGIQISSSNVGNNTINGNTIYNVGTWGIYSEDDSSATKDLIVNNTVINTSNTGIYARGINVNISNNTVRNAGADGGFAIYVRSANTDLNANFNISNNTIDNSSYGVGTVGNGATDKNLNLNITGNYITNSRRQAIRLSQLDAVVPYTATITNNKLCYNNASIDNFTFPTSNYLLANNTFCVDAYQPANNTLPDTSKPFVVNVTNTFNTTSAYPTSCYLFVNGAQVVTNSTVKEKTNTTFSGSSSAAGNWYVYCNDTTTAGSNTANSSLYTLAASSPPPSSGGSTGGEVLKPKVKDFKISVLGVVQVFRGLSKAFTVVFENKGETDLPVSSLSITGIDQNWLSIPSTLPSLGIGESSSVDITVSPPATATPNIYRTTATAVASGITRSTSLDIEVFKECPDCFTAEIKDKEINASSQNPVYTSLILKNLASSKIELTADAIGETRNWVLLSENTIVLEPVQEKEVSIEITPGSATDGKYLMNFTVSSTTRTQSVAIIINLKAGCPVCPSPKESGACVNGKQQLTSYVCSESTSFQCEPIAQEVSCSLVKKKKLLLPFWEAPLEHVEANLWWLLILIAILAYAVYRYYKSKEKKATIQPEIKTN